MALRDAGVTKFSLLLVRRYVLGDEPTDADHTIYIGGSQQSGWVAALDSILAILHQAKLTMNVEFLDPRAIEHFYLPSVSPTLSTKWPHLEVSIINILDKCLEWETMTLLNRGTSEEASKPTVTIGITRRAEKDWQTLMWARLTDLLEGTNLELA